MEREFYRVPEFCERYQISRAGFYREVAEGKILTVKKRRTTLIPHEEGERWLANLPPGRRRESSPTGKGEP